MITDQHTLDGSITALQPSQPLQPSLKHQSVLTHIHTYHTHLCIELHIGRPEADESREERLVQMAETDEGRRNQYKELIKQGQ